MKTEDRTTNLQRLTLIHIRFSRLYLYLEFLKYSSITRIDNRLCPYLKFVAYAILVWFFQSHAAFQKQISQNQFQEEKYKHELLENKYAIMQAQINFLSLFNISILICSKSITSEDHLIDNAVLSLSNIIRHSLSSSNQGKPIPDKENIDRIKKSYKLNVWNYTGIIPP